jgi:hypothetical protein
MKAVDSLPAAPRSLSVSCHLKSAWQNTEHWAHVEMAAFVTFTTVRVPSYNATATMPRRHTRLHSVLSEFHLVTEAVVFKNILKPTCDGT